MTFKKKKFITLLVKFITLSGSITLLVVFSLHCREVLHYREFITLLEQNIIIDIFQGFPLFFMAAILKRGVRIPLAT